jgi:hypothetical protein
VNSINPSLHFSPAPGVPCGKRASTSLLSVGVLDVLSKYASARLGRALRIQALPAASRFGRDEKCRLAILMEVADRPGVLGNFEGFLPVSGAEGWGRGEFGRVMGCLGAGLRVRPGRAGRFNGGRKGGQKAIKVAEPSAGFDETAMWSHQAEGFARVRRFTGPGRGWGCQPPRSISSQRRRVKSWRS